ncbi:hypothetical protein ACA910_003574 [Epithemia clementina (nom. ined.)]
MTTTLPTACQQPPYYDPHSSNTSMSPFASASLARMLSSKPKYPLSAYNLYFQLERKRILNGTDALGLPITLQDLQQVSEEHQKKGKRVHRRTHGKISFRDLARTVANRWKTLDVSTRRLLDLQALAEKEQHAKLNREWLKMKNQQMEAAINRQARMRGSHQALDTSTTPSSTESWTNNTEDRLNTGNHRQEVAHWEPQQQQELQHFSTSSFQDEEAEEELSQGGLQRLLVLQDIHRQIMAQIEAFTNNSIDGSRQYTAEYMAATGLFPCAESSSSCLMTAAYQRCATVIQPPVWSSPPFSDAGSSPISSSPLLETSSTAERYAACTNFNSSITQRPSANMIAIQAPAAAQISNTIPNEDWMEEQQPPLSSSSYCESSAAASISSSFLDASPWNSTPTIGRLSNHDCVARRTKMEGKLTTLDPLHSLVLFSNSDFIDPDAMDTLFQEE